MRRHARCLAPANSDVVASLQLAADQAPPTPSRDGLDVEPPGYDSAPSAIEIS
jgi:hypothetical protein